MELLIDGRTQSVREGDSLLTAIRAAGAYVPALCSHPALLAAGECSLCLVAVKGVADPVKACQTPAAAGMEVCTDTPQVRAQRSRNLKAILAHHPHTCLTCAQRDGCSRTQCSANVPMEERCCELLGSCELGRVADFIGIPPDTPRYRPAGLLPVSEPLFLRRPELCIGCGRCVRACTDLRGIGALVMQEAGGVRRAAPAGEGLAASGCRLCTACVGVCPTGALTDTGLAGGERDAVRTGDARGYPPCRAACPAGVDVPAYVRAVATGDYDRAVRVLRESLALPEVLARVCFHPCEAACRRSLVNEPLAIRRLKRAALAYGSAQPGPPAPDTGKKVAVVGAGPAGLAAADVLVTLGHRVTVLEARSDAGGMLRWAIPAYRLPREVLRREIKALEKRGMHLMTGQTVRNPAGLLADYDAVLLAGGAPRARKLGVPGEDLTGVFSALDFLAAVAADRPPDVAGEVVVIGGGHTALDAARTAVRLGARVTVVYRRTTEQSPAPAEEWAAAQAEGVAVLPLGGPVAFWGRDGLEGVELCRYQLPDQAAGRLVRPVPVPGNNFTLPARAAIVAVGQEVETALGAVDEEGRPSGLFAAGDLVHGSSSVVEAMASGRRAAGAIDRFLGGTGELPRLSDLPPAVHLARVAGFWDMPRPGFTGRLFSPVEAGCPTGEVLVNRFAEVEWPLTEEMADEEAGRCLNCDLRLAVPAAPGPPEPYRLLTAAALAEVPAAPGVYRLLDEGKNVVKIAGSADLRTALTEVLEREGAPFYFVWEENPMYTQRESQLIARFVEEHGHMPQGAGPDDLDDLF